MSKPDETKPDPFIGKVNAALKTTITLREQVRLIHHYSPPFAEIFALSMIEDIARIQTKLERFRDAAVREYEAPETPAP